MPSVIKMIQSLDVRLAGLKGHTPSAPVMGKELVMKK